MFILLVHQVFCSYDLIYEAFTSGNSEIGGIKYNQIGWNVQNQCTSNFISICESINIFGGYEVFGQKSIITNLISLKPHSQIKISLEIWKIGTWNTNEEINLFIDNIQLSWLPSTRSDSNQICGSATSIQVDLVTLSSTFDHNFNSVLIVIWTSTVNGFWGMSNFQLSVQPCPIGCVTCNSGEYKRECLRWSLAFQSLSEIQQASFNTDGWQVTNNKVASSQCSNVPLLCGFGKCAINDKIQKSLKLIQHTQLKIHFRYFKIDSWDDEFGIMYIDNQKIWAKQYNLHQGSDLCGWDSKEQGDNIEIILAHSNQNIFFEFTSNLDEPPNAESFGLRDFQIFINNNCQQHYWSECCGDSIKQKEEDCDDGNMIPFDGCHNCQYSCIDRCQQCVKGECLDAQEDQTGSEIIFVFQQIIREPQLRFQHNNLVHLNENCEINIDKVCLKCFQGFYLVVGQCQKICQSYEIEFALFTKEECICNIECIDCNEAICNICNYGSQYYDYGCQVNCGDKIVNKNYEECDDGNDQPYDGCFQCQFQCQQSCQICEYGVCLDSCGYGLYKINNQCESQCGDLIVTDVEQCDDGNLDDEDGCYNCLFICPKYCNDCFDGICQECNNNFYLVNEDNKCINICGDSFIALDLETCDDGNIISGDGCSNKCNIESNWIQNEYSEIVYFEESYFKVQYESQINQYQYVSLSFTTQMKRNSNNSIEFVNFIKIKLNIEEQLYTINIIPIQEAQTNLQWVKYQVEIIISENLEYYPQLEISLLETLFNYYDIPLVKLTQTIQLKKPLYISESQILASQKLAITQKNLIYSVGGLGATLVLCGFGSVVWTNLDMLQELYYLRFINVDYPQNVMIFFDSSDVIQLQYFIQKLNIFFFVSYLDFDNQQTNGKFSYYQINASLVINIQSFIFSLLSLGIFYLLCKYSSQILNKLNLKNVENNYCILYMIQTLSFRTIKLQQLTLKYGLQEITLKSGWNLLFMIFIQIQNGNTQTYAETFLQALTLVIFMGFVYFVFCYNLQKMLAKSKGATLDLLFQLKRICFMAVLIFFQQNQRLQILLLIIIYFSYLICFVKCSAQNRDLLDYFKKIITECSIMIFVMTSCCYLFDLSNNKKIIIGWFSIGFLIFGIISQLLCDIYLALKMLIEKIKNFSKNVQESSSTNQKFKAGTQRIFY